MGTTRATVRASAKAKTTTRAMSRAIAMSIVMAFLGSDLAQTNETIVGGFPIARVTAKAPA
jgi:hypothetical protein